MWDTSFFFFRTNEKKKIERRGENVEREKKKIERRRDKVEREKKK